VSNLSAVRAQLFAEVMLNYDIAFGTYLEGEVALGVAGALLVVDKLLPLSW